MSAHYEIFRDEADEWRWRLRASNGEIVASSESYTRREDAERAVGDVASASIEGTIVIGDLDDPEVD